MNAAHASLPMLPSSFRALLHETGSLAEFDARKERAPAMPFREDMELIGEHLARVAQVHEKRFRVTVELMQDLALPGGHTLNEGTKLIFRPFHPDFDRMKNPPVSGVDVWVPTRTWIPLSIHCSLSQGSVLKVGEFKPTHNLEALPKELALSYATSRGVITGTLEKVDARTGNVWFRVNKTTLPESEDLPLEGNRRQVAGGDVLRFRPIRVHEAAPNEWTADRGTPKLGIEISERSGKPVLHEARCCFSQQLFALSGRILG